MAYVGEIRIFAGAFAPAEWLFCKGQLVSITDYRTLFDLIGTTYGGDGQSTFALPDLRGRIPLHQGNGFVLAQTGGVEQVTLTTNQIPSHAHAMRATTNPGSTTNPNPNLTANSPNVTVYVQDVTDVNMSGQAVGSTGGGQPHTNFQPYLCVDFIISMSGSVPSRT